MVPILLASALSADPARWGPFLKGNIDPNTRLPHSYYAPPSYFDSVPESQRPHDETEAKKVTQCGGRVVQPAELNAYEFQTERFLSTLGLNIYDGAVRTVALAKLGEFGVVDDYVTNNLLAHKTFQFGDIRADAPCKGVISEGGCTDTLETGGCGFCYGDNGDPSLSVNNAYFFRMIGDYYALEGARDARCPDTNVWTWNDYRPVLGENAWANLVGPLQVEYLRARGNIDSISDDSASMKLATQIIPALEKMFVESVGFVYYAPRNTFDISNPDIGSTFSTENQGSTLAGLKMLKQILTVSRTTRYKALLPTVDKLINGIKSYFQKAYRKDLGYFSQGGSYNRKTKTVTWAKEPFFAVDCQTWVSAVIGPAQIDEWFGAGTALKIWNNTKRIGGYNYDASTGMVEGVGYTNNTKDNIFSGEWTFGAINYVKILANHYTQSSSQLLQEAAYMRQAVEKKLLDHSAPFGESVKYSGARYFIPFGWWANPIPSTASTAWASLEDADYNIFMLGGQYVSSY